MEKGEKRDSGSVLVTGGAGYIGSHVNKLLHRQGYDTIVYDNLSYGHRELSRWGTFVLGDLADIDPLRFLFENYDIAAVMHFAALTCVRESTQNPERYYRNNVANTLNLVRAMIEHGVRFLVFSSTCAVYGNPRQIPISEDHPLDPISPYGRSKRMVEMILADCGLAHDLRYASLRYFNAAGADPDGEIGEWHDPETHLIPLVLDAAIGHREDIKIFGLDYPNRDYAERAYREGRIDKPTYDTIRYALVAGVTPPQDTPLGGQIGIHGLGPADPSLHQVLDWTSGCIALNDQQIVRLAQWVDVGTRVVIQ